METMATVEETTTANADFERGCAGRPEHGRPAAFLAELFGAHAPMVLAICRGLLRDRHEAEDAAQQAFLSAYASLLSGTIPREPAAWLATIARNECRTRAQRRMREPLPVADTQESFADPMVSTADVDALRLALAQLPGQQRRAFLLREFSGLSYAELAAALGVTQPAVESLLFRARQQLRGMLRAAAAAAFTVPASVRDLVSQLFAGQAEGSGAATAAKLGSLPFAAKLASVGAGTALMTAGAVGVAPVHHHHHQAAARSPRVVKHASQTSSVARPVARALAVVRVPAVASPAAEHVPSVASERKNDTTQSQAGDRHGQEGEQQGPVQNAGANNDEHSGLTHSGEGDHGSSGSGSGDFKQAGTGDSSDSHGPGDPGRSGGDGVGNPSGSGDSGSSGEPPQAGD
jgi:RNA polymerase sigma-70 factor (ECF subfamily)